MKNPNLTRAQVEYYLHEFQGKLKDLKKQFKELQKDMKWYEDEIRKMKEDQNVDTSKLKK
jgi:hypothetical protein